MELNPYSAKGRRQLAVSARTGEPITAGNIFAGRINPRSGGLLRSQSIPLVAANGEFNADSKRDLMQAITLLQKSLATGEVIKQDGFKTSDKEVIAARQQSFQMALADRSGQQWQVLGEVIGDQIWETLGREGFARKNLLIKPLGKGEIGRVRIRRKDVVGWVVTTDVNVVASQVRQNYLFPPEFYILAAIVMEDREIEQSPGDLLDDKYTDGLEQMLVQEDKTFLRLSRAAATSSNDPFVFNTFTPTVFSEMRLQITRWGIPATTALIAFDIWSDITADAEFSSWFDPVTKHELILEGSLGSILGMNIITDAYRHETLQVLAAGEVMFFGPPQTLGAITQRKELVTEAINKYNHFKPERGWFMQQIEGMAIGNSRAIVRGTRG